MLNAGGAQEEDHIDKSCSRDMEQAEKFLFLEEIV